MKKDKKVIPFGWYCYTYKHNRRIMCPYWSMRDDKPEQECGYCAYLEKGDWNINEEAPDIIEVECRQSDGTYKKQLMSKEDFPNMSLLWDMCKKCNVNIRRKKR